MYGFSQHEVNKAFGVPRCSLQVRLSGKIELGIKLGHPTLLNDEENKIVDFECDRAALRFRFG